MPVLSTRPAPRPIAVEMRRRGIPTYVLAEAVGCSPQHLSGVINGRREPSAILRAALAAALGVPEVDLF